MKKYVLRRETVAPVRGGCYCAAPYRQCSNAATRAVRVMGILRGIRTIGGYETRRSNMVPFR